MENQEYDSVVITHGGCADGVTAAHMFELFPGPTLGRVKLYYSYSREFSRNREMPRLRGKKVFITDYSFPIEVLRAIAREASELYIWDHHETAFDNLFTKTEDVKVRMIDVGFTIICTEKSNYVAKEAVVMSKHYNQLVGGFKVFESRNDISTLDNGLVINTTGERVTNVCKVGIKFDMDLCGAEVTFGQLAIMHTQPGEKPAQNTLMPWYVLHVRDRDLWLWDKPGNIAGQHYNENSKAFGEAFFEMRICNDTLRVLDNYTPEQIEKMYSRGRELMEHNARFVKMIINKAERVIFDSYPAVVATCPVLQSEIGNTIVKDMEPEIVTLETLASSGSQHIPVIGIILRYNFAEKCWNVSLRGRVGSPNVASIAKKYGGGGHPMAAGFDYFGDISEIFQYVPVDKK